MSERKIVVPEGGLKAVDDAISEARRKHKKHYGDDELIAGTVRDITLAAFISWQLENGLNEKAIRDYCDKEFGGYDVTSERIGFRMGINYVRDMFRSPEPKVNPQKCPHRWQSRNEVATNERVIFCELCDWVHSRQAIEKLNW